MRASAYHVFTLNAFQARLTYRTEVLAIFFGDLVSTFARIAIWMSVYTAATSHNGVTLAEMITYSLLAGPVLYWDFSKVLYDVGDSIKTGNIAVFLLRPLHYPAYLMATHAGNFVFQLVVVVLPVSVVVSVIFGILPPASFWHGSLFIIYWILSFLILFSLAALMGLAAFWLMTAFSLEWTLQGLMALFSGAIVPLWFFPSPLAIVAGYLPFAWVSYYPSAVYLGKLDLWSAFGHLAIGLCWLSVLTGVFAYLWRKARTRLILQGG